MCQSLVDKVSRSQQLLALADPELLVLFEDWLEEMEEEVVARVQETGAADAADLARRLGLSPASTAFLLAKLRKEGRL
jgi:CRP-like cAMP-binding protein